MRLGFGATEYSKFKIRETPFLFQPGVSFKAGQQKPIVSKGSSG